MAAMSFVRGKAENVVQAEQAPLLQAILVPESPSGPRSAPASVIRGSTSTVRIAPWCAGPGEPPRHRGPQRMSRHRIADQVGGQYDLRQQDPSANVLRRRHPAGRHEMEFGVHNFMIYVIGGIPVGDSPRCVRA